ncbi:MAG: hypothetical protein ACNA7I_06730, partial [Candidatus Methanoperedens sp.]
IALWEHENERRAEVPSFPPCNKLQGIHAFGFAVYEESHYTPYLKDTGLVTVFAYKRFSVGY